MLPRFRALKLTFTVGLLTISFGIYYVHVHNRSYKKFWQEFEPDGENEGGNKEERVEKDSRLSIESATKFAEVNCPSYKDNMINVHFVLHSHDDPGWLKTVQTYYDDDVNVILNNVLEELSKDANRKFVQSEICYFDKWWSQLDNSKKTLVRKFISNGQLEFVGGGWVQNDDALTHYTASIDQLGYGLRKIKHLFGDKARPITSWQVDCFGYSKEQASIFAQVRKIQLTSGMILSSCHVNQAGFIAQTIHRIPTFDRETRRQTKQLEFLWKADERHTTLMHVLYNEYGAPNVFRLEKDLKITIKSYTTKHLFLIMGDDFAFKNAKNWFSGVDQLIHHGNLQHNKTNMNFFYSNPSCYFKAIYKELRSQNLSLHTDDFFPYWINPGSFWTGFYSSRPTLKRLIRETNTFLQTIEKFESVASSEITRSNLNMMRENFYLTLHHDAITGTCKQKVADDYVRMLNLALDIGQKVVDSIISQRLGRKINITRCSKIDLNYCPLSQSTSDFNIMLFNGHSKSRDEYVRVPIDNSSRMIVKDGETNVDFQVLSIEDEVGQLLNNSKKSASYELLFRTKIPALGYSTYRIGSNNEKSLDVPLTFQLVSDKNFVIENEHYQIHFDSNGYMTTVVNKQDKVEIHVKQIYFWYANGRSGVYVFRPEALHLIPESSSKIQLKYRKGMLCQEVKQIFDNETTQTIRLYKEKNYIEIEWTVGPIMAMYGKEIVTRFVANIKNLNTFFTDANGRQLMERKSDKFSKLDVEFRIATKYYPVTSMIAIKDDKAQLTLIPDRPLGGSSVQNGTLEVLLHRKLYNDDGAGMGEFVVEEENGRPIVVRGKFWITVTSPELTDGTRWRELAKEQFYRPVVLFSNDTGPSESLVNEANLPAGVHILSLQKLDGTNVLLRLENYLPDKNRTISIKNLLKGDDLIKCQETFITGDKFLSDNPNSIDVISLLPLEIRTFICQF